MTYIIIAIGCIYIFLLLLFILISSQSESEKTLDELINGKSLVSKKEVEARKKLGENSGYYKKRVLQLQEKLDLIDIDDDPESIIKYQFMVLVSGIILTILVQIIFNFILLTMVCIGVTIYCFMLKDIKINNTLKQKNEEFDSCLPQFENNMLLGLRAGAELYKAMELAIKTLPQGPVKSEFEKLLLESKTYTDNLALPFMNLSRRVPTKDCQRFCNVVVSGLKNGNSMGEILENESDYMTTQMLNKFKEKQDKNATIATAITSGFVFLPMIVLFLAPLMINSL